MVSLELLSSLDGLIWLQSGAKVGELFQEHQTTVSRNQKKCAQTFGITFTKFKNKWDVKGDSSLLQLEREIHQKARLIGMRRLRLEVSTYIDITPKNQLTQDWIMGKSKNCHVLHHIKCLRSSIIDAYLCSLNNLPTEAQDIKVIHLKSKKDIGFIVLKQNLSSKKIIRAIKIIEEAEFSMKE